MPSKDGFCAIILNRNFENDFCLQNERMRKSLVKLTEKGLYCEPGDFYIDPWRPVKKAVLTHAHADHTYRGNQQYLVPREGERLSRIRLGDEAKIATAGYGETTAINGVRVSFHPAGHVLGSAQILFEWKGFRAVVSGDYKRERDPTCRPFTVIPCDLFVTEATFGLPVFRHPPATEEIAKLVDSVELFPERGGRGSRRRCRGRGPARRALGRGRLELRGSALQPACRMQSTSTSAPRGRLATPIAARAGYGSLT